MPSKQAILQGSSNYYSHHHNAQCALHTISFVHLPFSLRAYQNTGSPVTHTRTSEDSLARSHGVNMILHGPLVHSSTTFGMRCNWRDTRPGVKWHSEQATTTTTSGTARNSTSECQLGGKGAGAQSDWLAFHCFMRVLVCLCEYSSRWHCSPHWSVRRRSVCPGLVPDQDDFSISWDARGMASHSHTHRAQHTIRAHSSRRGHSSLLRIC